MPNIGITKKKKKDCRKGRKDHEQIILSFIILRNYDQNEENLTKRLNLQNAS